MYPGSGAADAGDVGGVERGVAGVAAEDAEEVDASWKLDPVAGARWCRWRVTAVEKRCSTGVLHIVIHRLGDGDDAEAGASSRGIAERIVALMAMR